MSFAVRADSPFQDIKGMVEYARKNPGLKIASPGKQTLPYMVSQAIAKKENVKFTDVPFSGDATTAPALLGGHVPVAAIDYSVLKPLVDAKKVKVLASCTRARLDFAPDTPSVVDLGYPLAYYSLLGLFGQKNLPEDIVKKIDETVAKVHQEKEYRERLKNACIQAELREPRQLPENPRRLQEYHDRVLQGRRAGEVAAVTGACRRRRYRHIEGLFWIGIGLLICYLSWRAHLGSFQEPGPGFVPFVVGLFISTVSLIMLLSRILREPRFKMTSIPERSSRTSRRLRTRRHRCAPRVLCDLRRQAGIHRHDLPAHVGSPVRLGEEELGRESPVFPGHRHRQLSPL